MYSDAVRRKAQALRTELEQGKIDINSLKIFLLMVEGGDRTPAPDDALRARFQQYMDRKTKVRIKP